MGIDPLVHQRLRDHRLVLLVVAKPAKTHQVDHHVLLVQGPVIHRDLGREQADLGVIAVDVKDRRFDHFGHVGAIRGAARVARIRGREADLVVDDDVERAAGPVATGLGEVQRFHHHALAGDGRIAVEQDGHHLRAGGVVAAILPGPHRAFDHRIDDFQMRRVECQRKVHRSAGSGHVGRKTHVVFHVACGERGVVLAFEFGKELAGQLAEGIDQHVQPPAVRHPDHRFLDAGRAGALQQMIEHRDHRFAALARKPLLSDVFGMQIFFQRLGRGQPLEQVLFHRRIVVRARVHRLEAVLQPHPLFGVGDVHVFGAHRAAIRFAQSRDQVAQLLTRWPAGDIGAELDVHVGVGQTIRLRIELRQVGLFRASQRVDIGKAITHHPVAQFHQRDTGLLLRHFRVDDPHRRLALLGEADERIDDRRMGDVGSAIAQLVEVGAPRRADAGRVGKVALVLLFDEGHVAPEQRRGAQKLVHPAHGLSPARGTRLWSN